MDRAVVARMDFTKTNDISRHRYKFWYIFPNGETVRNEFAVPRQASDHEADNLAMIAWATALYAMVGRRVETGRANGLGRLQKGMADAAITGGNYIVARPGEREFKT